MAKADDFDVDAMLAGFDLKDTDFKLTAPKAGAAKKAAPAAGVGDDPFTALMGALGGDFDVFKKCAECMKPCPDHEAVTKGGKVWHRACIRCSGCSAKQADVDFEERDGLLFCRNCFLARYCPPCAKCGKHIEDKTCVQAFDVFFHTNCFVCEEAGCGEKLLTSEWAHEGVPLCKKHSFQRRGLICEACSQPIMKGCINLGGKRFHDKCFVCTFCKNPMKEYKEKDDKLYCKACFKKLF